MMESKTVAFHHFGCKVNFAEESMLSRQFIEKGYKLCGIKEIADVYVISTCMVTAVAEKKCRAAIRQAHKINPDAKIAVIGCYSELKKDEIEKIEGVNVILGHTGKFNLLEAIEQESIEIETGMKPYTNDDFITSFSYGDRTRSFLKIQDGCDYYCSYCTIPFARGHSRSDTIENVMHQADVVIKTGIKEIVLTGVNIGDFGRQNNESFIDLLKSLEEIRDIQRIRISSIEPDLLSDEIIDFIGQSDRIMPHFHIPLQSGSDHILKTMKRKYNKDLFTSRVQKIRSILPLACIASDVIVGFPGETEDDFSGTYELIERLDISYIHVFSYSTREDTLASKMTNLVLDKIKKQRSDILHALSNKKKKSFYMKNHGHEAHVLFESADSNGFMHGFTGNYIKVSTPYNPEFVNQIKKVKLEQLDQSMTYLVKEEDLI
jgi:threonylcarbamoyladenosine tRNA methylthiotransferase MtaB